MQERIVPMIKNNFSFEITGGGTSIKVLYKNDPLLIMNILVLFMVVQDIIKESGYLEDDPSFQEKSDETRH